MRKLNILLAILGGVLIGMSGSPHGPALQAAENAKTAPSGGMMRSRVAASAVPAAAHTATDTIRRVNPVMSE